MRYVIGTLIILLAITPALALDAEDYDTVTLSKQKEIPTPFCPVSKISDNNKCMSCHEMLPGDDGKPKFGIKELEIDAGYSQKPSCLSIIAGPDGKKFLRMEVTGTDSYNFRRSADYMYRHPEFNHLSVHLFTPGGSVMDAWRAVGIISEMQSRGIKVSTHCYGIAASAGVILLVAGDVGERYVNRHAEIMMHKLWTFKMFALETPDSAEDTAETLKHLQANINSWIISRSHLTNEKIEECIFKRDYWMTGETALELGLVDKIIN